MTRKDARLRPSQRVGRVVSNVLTSRDPQGTPLQEAQWLGEALAAGLDPNECEGDGYVLLPLHNVCRLGKVHLIEPLLAAGADPWKTNDWYRPAAAEAAHMNHPECMAELQRLGVDLRRELGGAKTLLHAAFYALSPESVFWLLDQGFDPYALDETGSSLVLTHIYSAEIVRGMIERGVNLSWSHWNGGETMGHRVARGQNLDVWRLLLETDVDLEMRNRRGETALALALRTPELEPVTRAAMAARAARTVLSELQNLPTPAAGVAKG